jgi:hypothetical protein
MIYEETISNVVKVVEPVGGAVIVLGGRAVFAVFARDVVAAGTAERA